ncbi:MAG: lipoprotein LpqH [Mycobacteriaceae bacterium]|nr:lipoprotein LpqH [Mycobacteriaceae bacterium]
MTFAIVMLGDRPRGPGFANGTYTVTGTARGSNPDDPGNPKTAPFRIEVECR